jgi:hypothetical protein
MNCDAAHARVAHALRLSRTQLDRLSLSQLRALDELVSVSVPAWAAKLVSRLDIKGLSSSLGLSSGKSMETPFRTLLNALGGLDARPPQQPLLTALCRNPETQLANVALLVSLYAFWSRQMQGQAHAPVETEIRPLTAKERYAKLTLEIPDLAFVFDLMHARVYGTLQREWQHGSDLLTAKAFGRLLEEEGHILLAPVQTEVLFSALLEFGVAVLGPGGEGRCVDVPALLGLIDECATQHNSRESSGTGSLHPSSSSSFSSPGPAVETLRILRTLAQPAVWTLVRQWLDAAGSSTVSVEEFGHALERAGAPLSSADLGAVWTACQRQHGLQCVVGATVPPLRIDQLHAVFCPAPSLAPASEAGAAPQMLSAIMRDVPTPWTGWG